MIITCASCQKRYLIEKEDLGPQGRVVRCVSCGHTWDQKPMEESVNYVDFSSDTLAHKSAPSPSFVNQVIGWGFYVLSLFVLIGGLYFARASLVSLWPVTAQAYRFLGVPVSNPYENLALSKVTPSVNGSDGLEEISVRGQVVNEGREVAALSTITLSAYGPCKRASLWSKMKGSFTRSGAVPKDLCVLDSWRVMLGETRIFPGEKLNFETRPHPVPHATNILVEF